MKCTHCGTNVKRRRRDGDRCPACKHAFAFDPARDRFGISDADFHRAIQSVSGGGRLFFDARQLRDELNRRPAAGGRTGSGHFATVCLFGGGAAGVALGVLNDVDMHVLMMFMAGMMAGMGVLIVGTILFPELGASPSMPPTLKIPDHVFRTEYLERWESVHGPIARLLPEPVPGAASLSREVPADVAAFSFDRVVVTQHADTAALLVANGFHFEHACAVLSLDGYPFGIAETVREMLRRNPRLTVFAVHDASAEGVQLPFTLRQPAWFPEPGTVVVDVGLRAQGDGSWRTRAFLPALPVRLGPRATLPAHVRKALPAGDVAWFEAGNRADLAALPPAAVMEIIQRAFAATALPGQPAHGEVTRQAAAGGGIVWAESLPNSVDDTAATDGFG
ncbi:MAG TPA: hypothetical protein VLK84_28550 [Longimicrobium sp.]|nr:hypothetical protein [Longimicrobium sp.]